MNNTEIKKVAKRLTFYEMLSQPDLKIEIPIIQRDYAQGRSTTVDIRDNFLDALYNYLEENQPFRDLDFVYGTIVKKGNDVLIPLDGQQRLTTLFLLHWYLGIIAGKQDVLKGFMLDGDKSKFTYETRTSSSEFCNAIINKVIEVQELKDTLPSNVIKNKPWFFRSWMFDPTIISMLNMLDSIHAKFNGKSEFFERLISTTNPVITFLFLNLKDFKLTDDLYIKMNARGKPLTTFENFKATLEKHISELNIRDQKFEMSSNGDRFEVSVKDFFSFNIDTKWSNVFWSHRSLFNKSNIKPEIDNNFDDELMHFIRVVLAQEVASDIDFKNNHELDNLEYLLGTSIARKNAADYSDDLSYNKFKSLGALSGSGLLTLMYALDVISTEDGNLRKYLNLGFYEETEEFREVLKHNLNQPQRVLFYAYIHYLIDNRDKDGDFENWIRLVSNLVNNRPIDSAEDVARAIQSIKKLLPYSRNILDYLTNQEPSIEFFYVKQVHEEILKAHLIKKSKDWASLIYGLEKHNYFKGQIAFLLEYSGILSYYQSNKNLYWDQQSDDLFYKALSMYGQKAGAVFENDIPDFLWERAVLSKGDYLLEASSNRWNFLSTKVNFRDYSWKRLLRLPPDTNSKNDLDEWLEKRLLVKTVLDDPNFKHDDLKNSLKIIIDAYNKDSWETNFVKTPKLLGYLDQGFIQWFTEKEIYLYKNSQRNHLHRELRSYIQYLQFVENGFDCQPFENYYHKEARGSEDFSGIVLYNFGYKTSFYNLTIVYNPNADKFDFFFNKHNNYKITAEKILDVLADIGLVLTDNNSYTISVSKDSVVKKLKKIQNALSEMKSAVEVA